MTEVISWLKDAPIALRSSTANCKELLGAVDKSGIELTYNIDQDVQEVNREDDHKVHHSVSDKQFNCSEIRKLDQSTKRVQITTYGVLPLPLLVK